jgi:predicted DNA-binding antitoxin AbrB/MazE fold protein
LWKGKRGPERIPGLGSNIIYPETRLLVLSMPLFKGFHMSDVLDDKVRVIYEDGVFKPLQQIELKEGTVALVVLKSGRITNAARRFRIKVDKDVMQEFVEERR